MSDGTGGRYMSMSYVDVNGLSLYYQEQGAGEPLIILHGGLMSGELIGPAVPELAKTRRLILPDLQAHGRTADIDRPMRWETMADDIAALASHLGLDSVDLMGISLGGGVAWRLAIQHPGLVRRLAIIAAPAKRTGWYPEVLAGFDAMGSQLAEMLRPSPLGESYARIAPRPQDWPRLLEKTGDLLRQDYDWSQEISALTIPVLLGYADADSVRPEHIVEAYAMLGGGQRDAHWDGSLRSASRLAIFPGRVHTDVHAAPELAPAVESFLSTGVLVPPALEG
jgi:pimeloyl-ACP methyl ester carboxylesterase